MKKILSLLLLSTVLGFVACDDDENPATPTAPTVTVNPTTAQNVPGATVTVKATVTAPGGAKTLSLTGGVTNTVTMANETAATEKSVDIKIPDNAVVGATIAVVFVATDNSNQNSAPATLTITVGNPVVTLSGNITASQTLSADDVYLISGQTFVKSGVTLTIPAGTVLKGDKASKGTLIIEPGAKLVANGTAEKPVVFTSAQVVGARDKGDWGGIVILGNAYVNQSVKPGVEGISPAVPYGTVDVNNATVGVNDENSGTLKYVRVEYAGIELTPNNETNGVTFGGVGSGTEVDYVEVSYGGDDAFEWFGGTVNAKHLVALATWDDDFDTDFGYRGHIQFGLVVRAPFAADQSGSTAFESDSQGNGNAIGTVCDGTNSAGCTQAVFSNITVLGPRDYTRTLSGNYTRAMHIRRRTAISIYNSVISGWPTGLTMDDAGTITNYQNEVGVFANNVLFVPILPTSASNSAFASGNAYYNGNAVAAANIAEIAAVWEQNSNITVKGTVVGTTPNFISNWAATADDSKSVINPYTEFGLAAAPFYAGQNATTYPSNPNFAVAAGSLVGFTAAELFPAASKVDLSFFDKTLTYKGAFSAGADWTDGWAEFQPQTKVY
jgi:hypothetical protein